MRKRGIFITFEGPEGCGKTTQSRLLYNWLKKRYSCVYTREPGVTRLGEQVREVLLHSKTVKISDLAEVFLFETARSQIVKEIIRPALEKGKIVICDRFGDATVAYQGYAGGVSVEEIKKLNKIATGGLSPDLTILLDIDTLTGLRRAKKKGIDRMEKKNLGYHKLVRAGYLNLEKKEPKRIKIIKVDKEIKTTQKKIRQIILEVIEKRLHSRGQFP